MATAKTKPSRTVFGKPGVTPRKVVGSAKGMPKHVGYRVSPVPHQYAPKAKTTGAIPAFPSNANANAGVATSGIGRKVKQGTLDPLELFKLDVFLSVMA